MRLNEAHVVADKSYWIKPLYVLFDYTGPVYYYHNWVRAPWDAPSPIAYWYPDGMIVDVNQLGRHRIAELAHTLYAARHAREGMPNDYEV